MLLGFPLGFSGIRFEVQQGVRLGIVDASGCSKNTLLKAFFSFVEVTNGPFT